MLSRQQNVLAVAVLLVVVTVSPPPAHAIIEDVLDVLNLGKEVAEIVLKTWEVVDESNLHPEGEFPFMKAKQKRILKRMSELSRQIDMIEAESVNIATWTIDSINDHMQANTRLELGLHELNDLMNRIATQEHLMRTFSQHVDDLEQTTLLEFAVWTVSPSSLAIQGLLSRIHLLMTGSTDTLTIGNNGILNLIAQSLEESTTQVCATMQSAQQVLFQLYSAISITELKGYAMMQFSWMLLKTYGKGNYTREAQLMRERFTDRTLKTQTLLRKVMERADRTVWRCDPKFHVRGETYEEITRLMQGFIENEVDLNGDNTCKENCAAYQYAENHGCYKDMFCSKQPKCNGKLLNCQFVDSDMWVCPSKSSSTRRYEFIKYENDRVLGKQGTCTRGTTKVDSWWRYLFWHCSYCLCMCDEQGAKSDRYFNLRETVSNVTANRVVTGLRFRKFNRIMHLQIQEGQLSARGMVNASTVQWKPVSNYGLLDRGIRNSVDYHTMAWDKRAIDLDDLIAPASHVVTGVRFRVVGTHLNLEIRQTEADFVTGRLIDPEHTSIWISNDNTDSSAQKRTAVTLKRPDVSTLCKPNSKISSTSNQYIEFTHTDVDADVAQTTVPFLDAQDVISYPPVALSGAGIYHKGVDLCGGFVAPKLITYDFAPHIESPQPDNQSNNVK